MSTLTRMTDQEGRLSLPKAFANTTVIIEQISDAELRIPALHGAMTAFRLPAGLDPQGLRQRLWEEYRVEAPIIERSEGLLVRVSTHFFNTTEEVDRLCVALDRLVLR